MKGVSELSLSWPQYFCVASCQRKESHHQRETLLSMRQSRLRKNYCGVSTPDGREIACPVKLEHENISDEAIMIEAGTAHAIFIGTSR
jgi:hypothetical protein